MASSLKYGFAQAFEKIKSYCAYQERSHYEVKEKLYGYGLRKEEVDRILAALITENYLNEQRFAEAYASGKFRIKHWGRYKIKQGLLAKRVSEYCIRKALSQIGEEEYYETLRKIIEKKSLSLREKNPLLKKQKLLNYAVSKGFESDLAHEILRDLRG